MRIQLGSKYNKGSRWGKAFRRYCASVWWSRKAIAFSSLLISRKQGGPCDAAVNFGMHRSLQQHRAVFTVIAWLSN